MSCSQASTAASSDNSLSLRSTPSAAMTPDMDALPFATIPAIRKSKHDSYARLDEWDAHHQTIARLYLYEEMTLKDVKAYMEANHAFFATEKMYKMRIKKWGLEKNTNAARVAHMLRRKRDRAAAGKTSSFSIHSRPVDWADIERYLQRRPDVLAKVDANNVLELGTATAGIVCRSPSPDPARMLSVPDPLAPEHFTHLHNDVLRLARDYMDGAFDAQLWHYSPQARCYLGRAGYVGMHRVSSWTSDVWSAVHLNSPPAAVVALLNAQMDHLTVMIREQDCSLLPQLLRACCYLHAWNPTVHATITAFVADMCAVQLGPRHPLSLAVRRLQRLDDPAALRETLADAARFRLEYLLARGARGEPATLILLEEHFMALSMRWQSNAPEIDRLVAWILDYVDRRTTPRVSGDYCRLMLRLASPQTFHGCYAVSRRLLASVREWLDEERTEDIYYTMVAAGYWFNLALLSADTGEPGRAREEMMRGVELCSRFYEPSGHLVGHVHHFALSFGVDGDPEKAARWRGMIEEGVACVWETWEGRKKIPGPAPDGGGEEVPDGEGEGEVSPPEGEGEAPQVDLVEDEAEVAGIRTEVFVDKRDFSHLATVMPKDTPCFVNPIGIVHPHTGEELPCCRLRDGALGSVKVR